MSSIYFLPYSASYPSTGTDYKDKIKDTWAKYKANFIDTFVSNHPGYYLVHDPYMPDYAYTPGFNEAQGTTSEGQGYGLLLALYNNDQIYFDRILTSVWAKMHNKNGKGLFSWETDKAGNYNPDATNGNLSATDGDIFITLAMVFADIMVKHGYWTNSGNDYGNKAQNLINNIYTYDVAGGRYLMPGDGGHWSGQDIANPSYFFTAALKTFKYYQATYHDWDTVIGQCYETLKSVNSSGTGGYFFGLSPDWCNRAGGVNGCGITDGPSGNGYDMTYNAIRVPWMIAVDAIWYNDPRAIAYCNNGMDFLKTKYGSETLAAQNAIMYSMSGLAFTPSENAYHSELTTGMWACGAMGSSSSASKTAYDAEFRDKFSANALLPDGYWGNWAGAGSYYFNQSLASFAALMLSGNFVNVLKDLETIPEARFKKNKPNLVENPFGNDGIWIQYKIEQHEPKVTIKIYNVAGELCREIEVGERFPGTYQEKWDGKNKNGTSVAAGGIYPVKIEATNEKFDAAMAVKKLR